MSAPPLERHATSPDGTRIAYWTSGAGPPLLLVHGSMSDHRRWRIVEALGEHRTVAAMDRRGRGGSDDTQPWHVDREVEDVITVVEQVADEARADVDLLGHSFGGYLSLRAAARTPRLRRLVVYEPAITDAPQAPETVARMRTALAHDRPDEVVEIMMREVVRMPEAEIEALRAMPSWPARVATAPTLPREIGQALRWSEEEAASVDVPTLLVVGGESPEFLQAAGRQVARSVARCEVLVLPGQQHVADQVDPQGFAARVLDFLLR